jgi:uncharacterized Zn-finger protein
MNSDNLSQAIKMIENGLVLLNAVADGDDAIESRLKRIRAGGGGSGRFQRRTGETTADMASEAANHSSRRATREGTAQAHVAAGDLHHFAGQEMKRAGHADRADEHFEKASMHYGIAKALQGDLSAGNANDTSFLHGRPTVENPKGSDPKYSDKGEYGDERRRNLEEAGGPFVERDPDTGNVDCPFCKNTFAPDESVAGKNIPEITCPRCSGIFRLADGRSIGTPEVTE